jgi:hypothetical protein
MQSGCIFWTAGRQLQLMEWVEQSYLRMGSSRDLFSTKTLASERQEKGDETGEYNGQKIIWKSTGSIQALQ